MNGAAGDVTNRPAARRDALLYHADPGSRSAEALALLGTLAATRADELRRG